MPRGSLQLAGIRNNIFLSTLNPRPLSQKNKSTQDSWGFNTVLWKPQRKLLIARGTQKLSRTMRATYISSYLISSFFSNIAFKHSGEISELQIFNFWQ